MVSTFFYNDYYNSDQNLKTYKILMEEMKMYSTLKTMQSIVKPEYLEGSIETHIAEYQTTKNPSILAAAYIKLFCFNLKTLHSYPFLSYEDAASLCLEILDRCLLTYNLKVTTKFISWYGPSIHNRFKWELTKNTTKKAKAAKETLSYDKVLEDGYDAPSYEEYDQVESKIDTAGLLSGIILLSRT
jgi:hypothetical protein